MHEDSILVVDDEELILRSTKALLDRAGYLCDTAQDVVSAAEMMKTHAYDLLITDIQMPGNSSLEFVKQQQHQDRTMPIILMTGYPQVDTAVESIQLGITAYLVKPFLAEQLLEKSRLAIQGNRIKRLIGDQSRRLQDWMKNLSELEKLSDPAVGRLSLPVESFIDLTSGNILGLVSDLKRITEAAVRHQVPAEACHLLHCPRADALYDAVRETIDVLEQTKSSFKSRELGVLRKKLELLIRSRSYGSAGQPAD